MRGQKSVMNSSGLVCVCGRRVVCRAAEQATTSSLTLLIQQLLPLLRCRRLFWCPSACLSLACTHERLAATDEVAGDSRGRGMSKYRFCRWCPLCHASLVCCVGVLFHVSLPLFHSLSLTPSPLTPYTVSPHCNTLCPLSLSLSLSLSCSFCSSSALMPAQNSVDE